MGVLEFCNLPSSFQLFVSAVLYIGTFLFRSSCLYSTLLCRSVGRSFIVYLYIYLLIYLKADLLFLLVRFY